MSVPFFDALCIEADIETKIFIKKLREQGYMALHPNDGWNDRNNKVITLSYPDFDDNCKVGDKIMLGWANNEDSQETIKLTAIYKNIFDPFGMAKRFYYEKINA